VTEIVKSILVILLHPAVNLVEMMIEKYAKVLHASHPILANAVFMTKKLPLLI
jgi:hypothetical protein